MKPAVVKLEQTHKRWATMSIAAIRMPDGQIVLRDVEDHGCAAAVLPYDPLRKMALLVEQLRAPQLVAVGETHSLEAIAGLVEGEDDFAATAEREALEEAGLRLGALDHVATAWSMPGISTERMALYLAEYRPEDRIGDGGGVADESEDVRVVEMRLTELAAMMAAEAIVDMKTLVLVQALRLRRPELFD
ncbi:NUDIX domain-containing protein [Methylocystis sp.]|uniref:NUDIX domain-containing protein n=1 Tax=Methylocystis sp. TaxID=1911079 RepID=UPI003D0BD168